MSSVLKDREILLSVCGGIAAYKVADLASKLVQAGAKVTAVMTKSATEFIGKTTFEALTGRPVYVHMFEPKEHPIGEHIGLARRAQLYVIAPGTADMIAKIANGFADDLASTLALTCTCPILVAPAMNNDMWAKPAVQRNIARLQEDNVLIVPPGSGWLSCGAVGPGRMAEPTEILAAIEQQFAKTV
jgi:phosphopantothenoylcysteine decarboxylase/phosphopantothenate--cysteine ligase